MIYRWRRITTALLSLLILGSVYSCLDQIDLTVPKDTLDGLVFQGSIIKSGDHATVTVNVRFLTNTGGVSEISKLQEAFIENDLGQMIELPFESSAHRAFISSSSPFKVIPGMKFRLVGKAVNGRRYESDFMIMNATPKIENLRYHVNESKIIQLAIDTKVIDENGQKKILKWDVENNYKYTDQILGNPPGKLCYVTSKADLKNVKLFDARNAQNEELKDVVIYDRQVDYFFAEGYYGAIIQQAIDEKSYQYFGQVNALTEREGNIYEPPAGTITTNMHELSGESKAFGFFYAAEQDTIRLFISPDEMGNPNRECPVPPSEISACPTKSCCDCLIIKGASLQRPAFWVN